VSIIPVTKKASRSIEWHNAERETKKDKEEGEEEEAFSHSTHESQKKVQEREILLSLNTV